MEYSKALPLYERALSTYEEFYGPDHELALDTMANLAKLKQELVSIRKSVICMQAEAVVSYTTNKDIITYTCMSFLMNTLISSI